MTENGIVRGTEIANGDAGGATRAAGARIETESEPGDIVIEKEIVRGTEAEIEAGTVIAKDGGQDRAVEMVDGGGREAGVGRDGRCGCKRDRPTHRTII